VQKSQQAKRRIVKSTSIFIVHALSIRLDQSLQTTVRGPDMARGAISSGCKDIL